MAEEDSGVGLAPRDVTRLVVSRVGKVEKRDAVPGVAVLDAAGVPVDVIAAFLATLDASDSTATTLYSYATALLRWWRFLAAVGVDWGLSDYRCNWSGLKR